MRFASTKQAASILGFVRDDGTPNTRSFLAWAKKNKLPPALGDRHHLWWDIKAIERKLDSNGDDKPDSKDWKNIITNRIKNGGVQNAVCC